MFKFLKLVWHVLKTIWRYFSRRFGMNIWAMSPSFSSVESWIVSDVLTLFGYPLMTMLFRAAGPFDTREEAQEWIEYRMKEKYPDGVPGQAKKA